MAVAAIAGGTVARTGLRPVARLTEAAERVARTDDLRPIPVHGSDELARLTEAFNMMLRALDESRERQTRLVSDAGHELRTPLTSLRTNVELLIASMAPGSHPLPRRDGELRADVIGQIEELSTLVGDLVDLTRGRRRRIHSRARRHGRGGGPRSLNEFAGAATTSSSTPTCAGWQVYGDSAGLSRAVLNLWTTRPSGARRVSRWGESPAVDPGTPSWSCRIRAREFRRRNAAWSSSGSTLHLGAGDAGFGPRSGHRQTGRAETWWRASRRGDRAGWPATGNVDPRPAAGPADTGLADYPSE